MGGNSGATRLDGLLSLLDSGTNATVRRMAADQIGDLVAAHPSETRPILRRVRRLLRSTAWETRIAASQAIAAIAEHSPRFVPQATQAEEDLQLPKVENVVDSGANVKKEAAISDAASGVFAGPSKPRYGGLTFAMLDLDRIMKGGAMLFGSSGDEYKDAETNIAKQRAKLKADLGLDDRFSQGDVLGLKDEDLVAKNKPDNTSNGVPAVNVTATADVVAEMADQGMSARERNRRKREAKKRARMGGGDYGRSGKRPRANNSINSSGDGPEVFSLKEMTMPTDEEDEEYEREFGVGHWDFQATCEVLKHALLEVRWEWRHGAAIGLRQILMKHATSAGRRTAGRLGDEENASWLEDICCRLLCVLAMDRFGDFVGDAVVAPVREAAAMTLGASARAMAPEATRSLVSKIFLLLQTDGSRQWEVRHAALLGARYVLAAKDEMAEELLGCSFQGIANGLRDQDDDVRAVAAEALLPVAPKLISFMPGHVSGLVTLLWDGLLDLDDISASTSSILRLLSEISSIPPHSDCNALWLDPKALRDEDDSDSEHMEDENGGGNAVESKNVVAILVELVPRLWCFLRHSSKTVRRASINLLETLATAFEEDELTIWVTPIFSDLLSRLFRNVLLETERDTVETSRRVWMRILGAFGRNDVPSRSLVATLHPLLGHWMYVASQESRTEAALYDDSQNKPKMTPAARRRRAAAARRAAKAKKARGTESIIPRTEHDGDTTPASEGPFDGVIMQQNAANALGYLAVFWPHGNPDLEQRIVESLRSPFASARRLACDLCTQWASLSNSEAFVFPESIHSALEKEATLQGDCVYAEVGASVGSFFTDSMAFLSTVPVNVTGNVVDVASLKHACTEGKNKVLSRDVPSAAVYARSIKPHMSGLVTGDTWEYVGSSLRNSGMQKRRMESLEALRMRILASIGYISSREEDARVALASSASAAVVTEAGCPLPQKVGPFIKALMAAVKGSRNPHLQSQAAYALSFLAYRLSTRSADKPLSLMLKNLMKHLTAEQEVSDEKIVSSMTSPVDMELNQTAIARRGSLSAFRELCSRFNDRLFEALPWLWSRIATAITTTDHVTSPNTEVNQAMVILRALVSHISDKLHIHVASLLPHLVDVCAAPHDVYSKHAPQCLSDVVAAIPGPGMQNVIQRLVPLLSGSQQDKEGDTSSRRGVATALRSVVDRLGSDLIPYAAFLVVPMMTRMVDEDDIVREAAAGVFGTLVRLMPLEGGAPDDPDMSAAMAEERREARSFLGQLLGTEPRSHYHLPVEIGDGIKLRKYQQECLDWLAFLNRYELHGALCDDMGLGKTLMTLCMVTGDFASLRRKGSHLPSLVICPSTIVAHWVQEAERFFGHSLPSILHYAGPPKLRARYRSHSVLSQSSLVVTSYDILGNDLRFFESVRWNYLVLDEGHVIKNPKTRIARAVRALSARHRLVLTGTPIQNSVLELWAMFDFLMPGFLGNEKSFKESYSKPIMASREGKCSEADQERGMVATEALHRQVLPFILRRLKDDVLSELPPKIMQDYYCSMTPIQMRLYEDFASELGGNSTGGDGRQSRGETHVFTALSYMRRLCSHPKLVLTPSHPEYESVQQYLRDQGRTIDDIESSAKLVGLMNILRECGIGSGDPGAKDSGGHRALIFAQLKDMLDLVENDLFRRYLPDVTYLRLDGSVEASKRQPIVTRFNADPTIDCLLLTTHVGGLGLNLTGADTVIFLEHDWNPTKDLQAMDRAHRMGQKRTVNVYRLITRGTLEEKIMGIQRFKTHIANTVVNRENSNLQSMNTDQLLDLFKVEDRDSSGQATTSNGDIAIGTGKGMKAALAGLGELWEENQYEDEYNMQDFLDGMAS
eukprot:GFKZ01007074.1.p1 GENE.GFKZ01007074.1~~GFKZ01007074.1.p1  ORF type:complete len:1849 (+),score=239.07 GFKZ01007074.1:129-5675(+)